MFDCSPYIKQIKNAEWKEFRRTMLDLVISPFCFFFSCAPPSSQRFTPSVLFRFQSRPHQSFCFFSTPHLWPCLTALANLLTTTYAIWFPGKQACLFLKRFSYSYLQWLSFSPLIVSIYALDLKTQTIIQVVSPYYTPHMHNYS